MHWNCVINRLNCHIWKMGCLAFHKEINARSIVPFYSKGPEYLFFWTAPWQKTYTPARPKRWHSHRGIFSPSFYLWPFPPSSLPSHSLLFSVPLPLSGSFFPIPSLKQSSITLIHLHYLIWVHSPDEASLLDGDCPILFLSIREDLSSQLLIDSRWANQ